MESVYKLELPEGWKPPFGAAVIVAVSDDPIASNEYERGELYPRDDYVSFAEDSYGQGPVAIGNLASNLNWACNAYVYSPAPQLRRKFQGRAEAEMAGDDLIEQFRAAGVPVRRAFGDVLYPAVETDRHDYSSTQANLVRRAFGDVMLETRPSLAPAEKLVWFAGGALCAAVLVLLFLWGWSRL